MSGGRVSDDRELETRFVIVLIVSHRRSVPFWRSGKEREEHCARLEGTQQACQHPYLGTDYS
jgi:hypothetical protein